MQAHFDIGRYFLVIVNVCEQLKVFLTICWLSTALSIITKIKALFSTKNVLPLLL